jgi:tRNA(Ile)-lysidine synthase TilS/MesJ
VEVNENKLKISISLQADGETLLSPRLYFNTFRFKLYCVALKLCMAYCAKSLNRCNFPMVIDDVFDSSDFENRYRIRNFIENLVNQHNLLDQAKAYPLQFIFFTQDDLISEGVHRGIRTTMGDENVKYGRIFDYKDKKDADRSTRNILKENDNFINLEDTIR